MAQQEMGFHPQGEAFNIDRLDRLTAIVERARLTFGVAAARDFWLMIGLPDLRTSIEIQSEEGAGRRRRRPAKSAGGKVGVRGIAKLRTSLDLQGEEAWPLPVKAWISRFLEERCERDARSEIPAAVMREAYRLWAEAENGPVTTPGSFGRFLMVLGVSRRKTKGTAAYVGIKLRVSAT